ncbi:MAG: hypothetical protein ACLUCU_05080 [Slackia sp.]
MTPTYPSKKKYESEKVLKVTVGFSRISEPELVERIEKQESRAGYLKRLVKEDIEREKNGK